ISTDIEGVVRSAYQTFSISLLFPLLIVKGKQAEQSAFMNTKIKYKFISSSLRIFEWICSAKGLFCRLPTSGCDVLILKEGWYKCAVPLFMLNVVKPMVNSMRRNFLALFL